MIILGIETSCDETACAVLKKEEDRIQILSNVVASSASLQTKYGGIVPEQAAREQIKSMIPVVKEALEMARVTNDKLDVIAVTYGPGLIGSLLVGVETAKVLAKVWGKPLVPINHLIGHFYANWIDWSSDFRLPTSAKDSRQKIVDIPKFPCLGLLVSGGHTDLVLFTDYGKYKYLGGTRDDAAGECFDKCARLLGLPYPGGLAISQLAQKGNPNKFKLPIPMKGSKNFDFSYSGLKTAVANILPKRLTVTSKQDLAAAIEDAIVESLIEKVIKALKAYLVSNVMLAGGVAANQKLVRNLKLKINNLKLKATLFVPPPTLCTDNAAMIAAAGFFQKKTIDPLKLQADPSLSLVY